MLANFSIRRRASARLDVVMTRLSDRPFSRTIARRMSNSPTRLRSSRCITGSLEKKGPAEAAGTREKQGERQILALPLAEILTGIELLASCIGEPVQKIAVLAQVDTIEHAVGVHPREQWIDHTAQIQHPLATGRRIGLLELARARFAAAMRLVMRF